MAKANCKECLTPRDSYYHNLKAHREHEDEWNTTECVYHPFVGPEKAPVPPAFFTPDMVNNALIGPYRDATVIDLAEASFRRYKAAAAVYLDLKDVDAPQLLLANAFDVVRSAALAYLAVVEPQ